MVIRHSSPCSGSVSSLLKLTQLCRRLQPEQVVLRSKDSRSKLPFVTNFYISVDNTKLHNGWKLNISVWNRAVRTGLRCLNPHLVPKDAINAFDLRPRKNKLRNKPRGFPGSTGPPGFCKYKTTNVKFIFMITATLSYKTARIKFYIAVPKTPLNNQLQYKSHIARNIISFQTQQTRRTKTSWTPKVTTTRLTDEKQQA